MGAFITPETVPRVWAGSLSPRPSASRDIQKGCVETFAAARIMTLAKKQATDMERFWNKYVDQDEELLSLLCYQFKQYTVDTILWVTDHYLEYLRSRKIRTCPRPKVSTFGMRFGKGGVRLRVRLLNR